MCVQVRVLHVGVSGFTVKGLEIKLEILGAFWRIPSASRRRVSLQEGLAQFGKRRF